MKEVAKDIINIKFDNTDTLETCMNKFFEVMRKYGIKEGTQLHNENGEECGRVCDNYDWTMCKTLFLSILEQHLMFQFLLGSVPNDLLK